MGRIVVSYPGGDGAGSTRLDVFAAGNASKAIASKYGDAALELMPGSYDAAVGGRRITDQPLRPGLLDSLLVSMFLWLGVCIFSGLAFPAVLAAVLIAGIVRRRLQLTRTIAAPQASGAPAHAG